MTEQFFLRMITLLRNEEQVLVYACIPDFSASEGEEVKRFLATEYANECLEYPGHPPAFDASAALWAAQYVYITAQLILYRETPEALLPTHLPEYNGDLTPESILSADLCLRFLPVMLEQITLIDPEDALIPLLRQVLEKWHFSAALSGIITEPSDTESVLQHPTIRQLYCDRIIRSNFSELDKHPAFQSFITASLGFVLSETTSASYTPKS